MTPAPNPTPAKMMPLAMPRSEEGIQRATTELDAVRAPVDTEALRDAVLLASDRSA